MKENPYDEILEVKPGFEIGLASVDPPGRIGFIYVITAPEAKALKIGFAADPWARFRNLQTGSPQELHLFFNWPASYGVEAALHRRFKHLHIRGEWYRADDEIFDFLDDLGDEIEP